MGNKKKVGKSRRDKFYQLAKESGFRARSAFKLIQLNRKFEFLQKSRVVIDLCAAPGGWLQVVTENTPVSSLIVGVDLVPIKPIRNVTTLVDDITTDKCRKDLKKELQTWKADCVLHDGAPNVGKNWIHDAFQQVQLTLQALKLATEFLKKGGWFVTKVFRSKDYNSLLWVLQQLFKHVNATKPQASRNESAEIFVVCQHFLAPDRIDPKFLDPKAVFREVENEAKPTLDLIHPEKKKRYRDGYPEGDYTLFHTLNVSNFLSSDNYLQLLSDASKVIFDDKTIEGHPLTTKEIKECLNDIKVLGKKEIRMILNWRKKIKAEQSDDKPEEKDSQKEEAKEEEEENSEDEIAKLEEELSTLKGEERKKLKNKIKKTRKEKKKLQHKMDMKMVLTNDPLEISEDRELFNIHRIKSKQQLEAVEVGDESVVDDNRYMEDDLPKKTKQDNLIAYDRDSKQDYLANLDPNDIDDESEMEFEDDDSDGNADGGDIELEEADEDDLNPLLLGRPGKKAKTDRWFSKDAFAGLDDEADEDVEIEKMVEMYKKKGGVIKGVTDTLDAENSMLFPGDKLEEDEKVERKDKTSGSDSGLASDSDDDDDSDSDSESEDGNDSDSDSDAKEFYKELKQSKKAKKQENDDKGFEVVPVDGQSSVRLSAKGLALGAAIVSSRKRRREVVESGYHRYMTGGAEDLPEWFQKDEVKHQQVQMPITKGDIEEYKMKMKVVDANPIKKVAEAKARKKRKMIKKLDRARKKANNIDEVADVTDKEKWQQIKQVYKRAGLLSSKKKEIAYVVAKKGMGKRAKRPQGIQGPYKVVDSRMKKDKRAKAAGGDKKGGKGSKKGGAKQRGKQGRPQKKR